jgi:ketosteroid isomerase-like protein
MMDKRDNIQLVQRLYAAFARGDVQVALNTFSDDVDFQHPMSTDVWPWAGKLRGREQVARFFAGLTEVAEWEHFEPQEFIAQGGRVVATVYERLRLRANGRLLENEMVNIFTLKNGKIVQMRIYEDTAPIIAAIRGQ